MCTLYVYTYHRTYVIACDIYIYILFLHMHTHIHTPEYTLTQAELNLRCTCNLWRGHMAYMASLWAPFLFCFLACGFVFPAGFSPPQVPGAEKEGLCQLQVSCPASEGTESRLTLRQKRAPREEAALSLHSFLCCMRGLIPAIHPHSNPVGPSDRICLCSDEPNPLGQTGSSCHWNTILKTRKQMPKRGMVESNLEIQAVGNKSYSSHYACNKCLK